MRFNRMLCLLSWEKRSLRHKVFIKHTFQDEMVNQQRNVSHSPQNTLHILLLVFGLAVIQYLKYTLGLTLKRCLSDAVPLNALCKQFLAHGKKLPPASPDCVFLCPAYFTASIRDSIWHHLCLARESPMDRAVLNQQYVPT